MNFHFDAFALKYELSVMLSIFQMLTFAHLNVFYMLLSMTGYGRASRKLDEKSVIVEMKSLNSKYLDLKTRLPQGFHDKEMVIRQMLTKAAKRGKIDISVEIQQQGTEHDMLFNKDLFAAYYKQLKAIKEELGISDHADLVQSIMRIPNVTSSGEGNIDDKVWQLVQDTIKDAVTAFNIFRKAEGDVTEQDFRLRVSNIQKLLKELAPFEAPRIERLRERYKQQLSELKLQNGFDENRFEQEIIFYIEKLDLSEEKLRLEQHCDYFIEQLDDTKLKIKGKKLNFISQEMGREINTLGSKANNADIQRIVVQMKDELEKIKEQTANIL